MPLPRPAKARKSLTAVKALTGRKLRGLKVRGRKLRGLKPLGLKPAGLKALLGEPRLRRRAVQAAMLACVFALAPAGWMHAVADSRVRTVADAPARDVAVVFGAGLREGRPSPYLAHRLDAAAELYRAGRVKVVLVTGDNSRVEYDEPDAMRAYLVERGVPDRRIVSDYAGFDTWDSCVRAKKIFGVERALLVTQSFHVRRAVALCGTAGIDVYGVGVAEPRNVTWYYGAVREIFASGKAAADAATDRQPTFLGPAEPGVTEALDHARTVAVGRYVP